jgi:hypothetical protein
MEVERSVTIGTRFTSIDNVLSMQDFLRLRQYCRTSNYKRMPKGNGTFIYYADMPRDINDNINKIINQTLGKNLKDIISFVRLNTSKHDTEFRVHADQDIFGQTPTVAALFYLDSSDITGTAFFSHPVYGNYAKAKEHYIFDEDDGQWSIDEFFNSKANTLLIYDAKLYHGRQPWLSEGINQRNGRIVIVKFMRENDE